MAHYTADNPAHIGCTVFLDGVEMLRVTECDTTEGWLIRAKADDNGNLTVIDGEVALETLHGTVTVKESA